MASCGECLMNSVEIVELQPNGRCPRCGADYGTHLRVPTTHYCDWDARGKRAVRAICGAIISRREHTNAPTCPTCTEVLARRVHEVGP
jgi:predicted RNA-binding Zn-ribbon protein involved in translation (DUF1610 family)